MASYRQLEVFVAVYEENNMTKAAKRLFMTQPAVSQAIREIETEYETSMFERMGPTLYVTQAGQTLYHYTKRVFALLDDMKSKMTTDEATAQIRVGCNISAGTVLIRSYIHEFEKQYPNIDVHVAVTRSTVLEQRLFDHDLDFCIMEDLERDAGQMVQIPYYKDRIVVVAAPDHPLANREDLVIQDLKKEHFLMRERGAGVRDKFDYILKLNDMNVTPYWESSSTTALANAVMDGFGISILPNLLIQEYLEDGRLVPLRLLDVSLERNLNIVYHKDKVLTKPMQYFIDLMQQMEKGVQTKTPGT